MKPPLDLDAVATVHGCGCFQGHHGTPETHDPIGYRDCAITALIRRVRELEGALRDRLKATAEPKEGAAEPPKALSPLLCEVQRLIHAGHSGQCAMCHPAPQVESAAHDDADCAAKACWAACICSCHHAAPVPEWEQESLTASSAKWQTIMADLAPLSAEERMARFFDEIEAECIAKHGPEEWDRRVAAALAVRPAPPAPDDAEKLLEECERVLRTSHGAYHILPAPQDGCYVCGLLDRLAARRQGTK